LKPLFRIGRTVATPGALAFMVRNGINAGLLLDRHARLDDDCDASDAAANRQALVDGSRVFSVFRFGQEKLWVISEAVGDGGFRASSCITTPSEY
jgi:hypothetical protein